MDKNSFNFKKNKIQSNNNDSYKNIISNNINNNKNNINNNKYLIIFDVDKTITNEDSLDVTSKILLTKNQLKALDFAINNIESWSECLNYFYCLIKINNKSIQDIKNSLKKVKLTEKFQDVFSFLRENKKYFDNIIISSGNKFSIKNLMQINHFNDIIKNVYANESYILNDRVYIFNSNRHQCDICDISLCKKTELDKYLASIDNNNNNNNEYKRFIFICDGYNDLCLVRYFKEDDYVLLRKNYDLYNTLYNENIEYKIICNLIPWENGDDIIQILNKILTKDFKK